MGIRLTLQHQNIPQIGIECALCEIGQYLEEYGKQLSDFGLHQPLQVSQEVQHEFHDGTTMQMSFMTKLFSHILHSIWRRKTFYDEIIGAVINQQSLYLFIDGKAGCGKNLPGTDHL